MSQISRGVHWTPASKDTNIVIEINYINIAKLLLFCRGEPCSPIRVQRTRIARNACKIEYIIFITSKVM